MNLVELIFSNLEGFNSSPSNRIRYPDKKIERKQSNRFLS